MPRSSRKYSRPNGQVDKIYPLGISKVDSDKKSMLTRTKTIGVVLNSGEAAKLAVALINAISMLSKECPSIDLTITIHNKQFSVSV